MKSKYSNKTGFRKINIFLLSVVALFVSFSFMANIAKADEYEKQQVLLEKYGSIYYSPVVYADRDFYSVIITGDTDGLMVNFNPLGNGTWSAIENDGDLNNEAILFTPPTDNIQFKKTGKSDKKNITLNVEFLNTEMEEISEAERKKFVGGPEVAYSGLRIITRKEWGADESLRYWSPDEFEAASSTSEGDSGSVCKDMESKYSSELGIDRTVSYGPNGEYLIWPVSYTSY